jgi:hypothetical protein
MAGRRVRLVLSGAATGLVLMIIAATSTWFKGVAVANATIVEDNLRGSPMQNSNATPNKSTSSGSVPQARSKGTASTRKPALEPNAEKLPPLPETWQEHWSEHRDLVKLVASNEDVAIYFDDAMPRRGIAWMVPFVTKAWQYTKKTYGNFGPDPRLFAIFHQGKYNGGHPSTYFDDSHDHRNVSDCGLGNWDHYSIDFVSHEIGHIVEGGNNSVEESPAFEMWKDSKWIEFYQYDLYAALGLKSDARRIYEKWYNQTDDFPRPGTHWFRDFFYPLWREHGHAQVMVNFFELVAKYFPRGPYGKDKHPRYTRRMNWGEFIHFMSGAAHKNLKPLARKAFGWPAEWDDLYKKARDDFLEIKYKT